MREETTRFPGGCPIVSSKLGTCCVVRELFLDWVSPDFSLLLPPITIIVLWPFLNYENKMNSVPDPFPALCIKAPRFGAEMLC